MYIQRYMNMYIDTESEARDAARADQMLQMLPPPPPCFETYTGIT